ncbi:2OG-Fe(II) oxygenase [Ancylothrix sp. C2]|uniref:2OG-Fe(II) oxygenase n=1 Tax=Ancylothrix sp. D3o TaxID=2953691 RepID=UPI0021BB1ABF|nr:2OG-Fe(II) oxygenase [Ancylothrix sp. D3o]MCT7949023.1 2OG-Fe(II) oxygenase [Ancylothrix sp. D3o]
MQTELESKEVKVKLLLLGGHEYTIWLKSDAVLLESLLKVLVARSQNQQTTTLFQIPLEESRSALCFPSEHLVGVITEPAIFVQQKAPLTPKIEPVPHSRPVSEVLPSYFLQFDNFLKEEELGRLLKFVGEKQADFTTTTTSTGAADYRKSWVLHQFPEFAELMIEGVRQVVPDVLSKFSIPNFEISQVEAQLTAHNDGNYYKVHNDNGSAETATRTLTYVYYFYRQPKAFSGGELVIYDSKIQNNYYVKADSYKTVDPRNNSVVFFLSRYMHEVLPVRCPSQEFLDSRFTINGWVRR